MANSEIQDSNPAPVQISEETFRLLVDSVKDYGIFMLDLNGYILTWNQGAERMNGYSASEAIGKNFEEFYTKIDREKQHPKYELKMALEVGRYEEEGWRVRKDGTPFWTNVIITRLDNANGTAIGFAKVTRDLTERKIAEDRLKKLNEGLERRVEERTYELQQAITARDEFLSIASHELRTPVTPLKLQIQRIIGHLRKDDLSQVPKDQLEKMTNSADRALNRLEKLIDNLLDVARINAGKIELYPEELNIGEVIFETCNHLNQEAHLAVSGIQVSMPKQIITHLDRTRLEQVVTNLVVNAIKYGNGKSIEVKVTSDEDCLIIEVKDEGLGIATEDIHRIFNRFEQVAKTGTRGLGLGLYITKQIIDAQHGSVQVKSMYGKGSTFTVKLPLSVTISPYHEHELKR